MKSSSAKSMSSKSGQKSKKSSGKDKDRRKSHNTDAGTSSSALVEKHDSHGSSRHYAGFGSDTIACVSDQTLSESISEEIASNLAEDASYKIRQLIHSAATIMRQSKRTVLKTSDIAAAMQYLSLEPVYGASAPGWIQIQQNYSCLMDTTVNLVDMAKAEMKIMQPDEVALSYRWLSDMRNEADSAQREYFFKMAKAALRLDKPSLSAFALNDISKNCKIGPILPWFCNICFMILQKDISFKSMTNPTLNLLEAVLRNPNARLVVPQKQLNGLTLILLEKLVCTYVKEDLSTITKICRLIGMIANSNNIIMTAVTKRLSHYFNTASFTTSLVELATYLGGEVMDSCLWFNVSLLMDRLRENLDLNMVHVLMLAISHAYRTNGLRPDVEATLFDFFGEYLVPLWVFKMKSNTNVPDTKVNWREVTRGLIQTRKIVAKQVTVIERAETKCEHHFESYRLISNSGKDIRISIPNCRSFRPNRRRPMDQPRYRRNKAKSPIINVISGRRTLLEVRSRTRPKTECTNHELFFTL